eukprot:747097-Hanusia_phi.AAC.6
MPELGAEERIREVGSLPVEQTPCFCTGQSGKKEGTIDKGWVRGAWVVEKKGEDGEGGEQLTETETETETGTGTGTETETETETETHTE